jgi:Ca-activated chloride channel family protein
MPAQGSRADLAVARAIDLLRNAGQTRGDILLVTDGLQQEEINRLSIADTSPYRVSILAVGTADGAPIPSPDGSGFVKDREGSIVIARTDHGELQQAAQALGGSYQRIRLDESDITQLQSLFERQQLAGSHKQTDFNADRWAEEGPWLLLLVLPLAALLFRRGVLLALVIGIFVAQPEPSYAESGWDWSRLWLNNDQRAQQRLAEGESEQAAEQFNNPDWKAAAQYRAGQYEQALQQWARRSDPDALYNRGNSLAQMGRLKEALASYDELLARQPQHEDAAYNRDLVEKALKQQQQQQQQNQQSGDGEQSQQGENGQSQDESQSSQQPDSGGQSAQAGQESSSETLDQQAENAEAGQDGSEDPAGDAADQVKPDENSADAEPQMQADESSAKDDSASAASEQEEAAQASGENVAQAMTSETEELTQQAEAQWLRRIPDDPGGLLRNKFRYQYSRQPDQNREEQQW